MGSGSYCCVCGTEADAAASARALGTDSELRVRSLLFVGMQ